MMENIELQEKDFEQVEESLWEEYLLENVPVGDTSPECSLIKLRMNRTMTVPLALAFTNIFYVIVLFLAWYIPAGALYGISLFEGAFIMTFVVSVLCVSGYDENHVTMHSLLVYFPVNAKRLRKEMYAVVGKYMGIQTLITVLSMLVMSYGFEAERFFITVVSNVVAMLVVGILSVEGSMRGMKAKE